MLAARSTRSPSSMSKLFNDRSLFQLAIAVFFFLIASSDLSAQTRAAETNTIAGNEEIHGAIQFPSGYLPGVPVTVTLQSLSQPEIKIQTDRDGEFRFFHLRPDHY